MGDAAEPTKPKRTRRSKAQGEKLADFVADRAPDVYITFLSILIGIVLADLLEDARDRLVLWPLDLLSVRNWAQIAAIAGCALGSWGVYAHLGIVQRQVPRFRESLAAFAGPLILLFGNGFLGQPNLAPWLAVAAMFLATSALGSTASVMTASAVPEGSAFRRLLHPLGFRLILIGGVPFYAAAAVLVSMGLVPLWAQTALLLAGVPPTVIVPLVFFRDWKNALDEGPRARREAGTPPQGRSVAQVWAREKVADVFVTLISITIGLALQDLLDQARAHMRLWPLDRTSLMVWFQIAGLLSSSISAWAIYSHLAISRRGLPSYVETLSGAIVPLFIVIATTLTGRELLWPWFYAAGLYLGAAALSVRSFTRFAADEEERALLQAVVGNPWGCMGVMYAGSPLFLGAGLLSQFGWLPDWLALVLLANAGPSAMLCTWLFFRDWRRALGADAPLA